MIYIVPIEPLEERYSTQWYNWFHKTLKGIGKDFNMIEGEILTSKITSGSFLDICGTNFYKASQLMQIAKHIHLDEVKDGDSFLFHDGWFPGVESLAYMRDGLGINFKIYGIFHAGTYDPYDFLTQQGMKRWGKDLENSWFEIYDGIFVATEFHKKLLLSKRKIDSNKIHITYFPIYDNFHVPIKKENLVVFPHRLDPEKRPEFFDRIKLPKDWKKFRTKDNYIDKTTYYINLNQSKIAVSFALQETWGICMQEAVFCGCIPLVPDRLSYSEQYPDIFKYYDMRNFQEKLNYIIENIESETVISAYNNTKAFLLNRGTSAIKNMVRICENT